MATIRDIAKESGFSVTTVSIVLNNARLAEYIPIITKTHIKEIARKRGYHPNVFARSLRTKRSESVGVMVFDITDPYCSSILRGIQNSLYRSSFVPILTDVQHDDARFEHCVEMLLDRRVEGLIAIANSLALDVNILATLQTDKLPTVLIGRESKTPAANAVIVDNKAGARMAVEHLYQLGHRKIAFIRGPKMLADSNERWRGIQAFAQQAGLELDPRLVVDLPNGNEGGMPSLERGHKVTHDLLRTEIAFTAIMAFDDLTAFGAIRALAQVSRRVPADCSVVGFDDVLPAGMYTPALTTIRQPMELMGSMSVDILLEAIASVQKNRPFSPVYRRVMPELVIRESTQAVTHS